MAYTELGQTEYQIQAYTELGQAEYQILAYTELGQAEYQILAYTELGQTEYQILAYTELGQTEYQILAYTELGQYRVNDLGTKAGSSAHSLSTPHPHSPPVPPVQHNIQDANSAVSYRVEPQKVY